MRSGQLRHPIVIQSKTDAKDDWGTPLPGAWADYATLWSNVRHQSGSESIKAGADTSVVRASIRIRYRLDITAGMRVVHLGVIYDIEAVLPGQRRDFVDLTCKRVGDGAS